MGTRPDFDEWVGARGESLLRLAYLLTGDRDEADDAVQEALSRALPRWSRISGRQDPDTDVIGRVVNVCVSRQRRRQFEQRATPVPIREDVAGMTGMLIEDHSAVWEAFEALPVDQRSAIVLRYYQNLDLAEIADLTGVREGSVRSRVSLGLAVLRAERGESVGDFEKGLRDRLTEGAVRAERAEEATRLSGLAVAARARLRQRRTTIAQVTAGAAIVAVASVGIAWAGGDGNGRPPAPKVVPDAHFIVRDLSPQPTSRDDGMDEVTWRGIRFSVPPDWQPGAPTAWCSEDKDPAAVVPRIALPGMVRPKIACTPTNGYGVTVSAATALDPARESQHVFEYDTGGVDAEALFPNGSWVFYWYDDNWVVTIATADPGLTSRIAQSVRVQEVDANGCVVTKDDVTTRGPLVHLASVPHCFRV